MYAKFKTTIATDNITRIAIMANDVVADIETNIEAYPGCDPIICAIELTNDDGTNVCEVSQKFTMSIENESTKNLPIEFTLYSDENCTEIITLNDEGIYEDDNFKFEPNQKEIKTYYLKIIWPEDKNDQFYAFEIDYLNLQVKIEQVD